MAAVLEPIGEALGIDQETVEAGKEKVETIVEALDAKAEKIAESLENQGEVLGASYRKKAAATPSEDRAFQSVIEKILGYILPMVFSTAAFLVTQWKWTVSASILLVMYFFFRRSSSRFPD